MHKGYLKSDGTSQAITYNKADATAMWIMDAEYYVKSQKKGTIEKIDKSLPDRVGRNYIVTFDKKMKKGGMAKSETPKGKSVVKKEKKTKEPKIVRGFFDDEPYEYAEGGYMAKGGKTDEKPKTPKGKKVKEKEPQIVRGYFDDEPYEYGDGGAIYVGDKVKIKGSNKTMVVKNISKGKKGYVEFSGDGGTFLKGDIEKYAEGGFMKSKMDDYISSIAKSNKKQFSVNQYHQFRDKKYDFGVSNGFFLDTDDNYSKFDKKLGEALNVNWDGEYEKGGSISSWNYDIGGL